MRNLSRVFGIYHTQRPVNHSAKHGAILRYSLGILRLHRLDIVLHFLTGRHIKVPP